VLDANGAFFVAHSMVILLAQTRPFGRRFVTVNPLRAGYNARDNPRDIFSALLT
jgi:hypothetical protein